MDQARQDPGRFSRAGGDLIEFQSDQQKTQNKPTDMDNLELANGNETNQERSYGDGLDYHALKLANSGNPRAP